MLKLSWVVAAGVSPETASRWLSLLERACDRFGINTDKRLAVFLAQCAHESSGFLRLMENLNYSAERLMQVWPKRFRDLVDAEQYAHAPAALGNHVYAGRMGNGGEASGDGYKFRGRGLIPATGRNMYMWLGQKLRIDCLQNPDLLLVPEYACLSAGAIWHNRGLNTLADQDDFMNISARINLGHDVEEPSGINGYRDRRVRWESVQRAIEIDSSWDYVKPAKISLDNDSGM